MGEGGTEAIIDVDDHSPAGITAPVAQDGFQQSVEDVAGLGCSLTDCAEHKVVSDVIWIKEGETKIGLVFLGDGAAEVGVFEVYFYAVVCATRLEL